MKRKFNTTGSCDPQYHYMVDIRDKLEKIKRLVDDGEYFTVNRARQYGKTTTLKALVQYLDKDYVVLPLDFQKIGNEEFSSADRFSSAIAEYIVKRIRNKKNHITGFDSAIVDKLETASSSSNFFSLRKLFDIFNELCDTASRPVVLIIDEVDSATENQVFLDFLAQLRADYLDRDLISTFHSVILAGVYDVKNIKRKIRPEESEKTNSPWNIAADFKVAMSLSQPGIKGMLDDYESDHATGMDTHKMAQLIFDYTSGYPFLVSRICKLIDEDVSLNEDLTGRAWTNDGFLEAVKLLLAEKNTLFESLTGKLLNNPEISDIIKQILFSGYKITYNPDEQWIDMAMMFGFIKNRNNIVEISNRIFETRLYNYFLSATESQNTEIFKTASQNKPLFVKNGKLDMKLVLEKYVEHFDSIYGDDYEVFSEAEGRRRFLLYLRPIINGVGNYYIEAHTRNERRMDVVVDYLSERFVIELKIWRGNSYNEHGEQQTADYLSYYKLMKGYMLSYNFNKNKKIGVKEISIGDKILVEAVV